MKLVAYTLNVAFAVCQVGMGQVPAAPKPEFEAVAIKAAAPQAGHFRSPGSSAGGPGTVDPAMFRCSNCTASFLITKAFALERYQFPGQAALPDTAFDISARIPEGTTADQFALMLQSLLKDRFNLSHLFDKKPMQGYELVVGKSGPKLTEAKEGAEPSGGGHQESAGANWHGSPGNTSGHELTRPGLMYRNGQAKYRGDHQTMEDLARMISTQLSKPVDDHTGLPGKYDISLSWSDDGAHAASHPGGWGGPGGGGGEHGERGAGPAQSTDSGASGQTLLGAVQTQLGLRLEPKKATASLFVVDHIDKAPSAN